MICKSEFCRRATGAAISTLAITVEEKEGGKIRPVAGWDDSAIDRLHIVKQAVKISICF